MMRCCIFFFISFCFSSSSWIANDISGVWCISDQDANVKIYSAYGKFYGHVVWMNDPNDSITGNPQLDIHNKDPKLRSQHVMDLIVLKELEFDADEQEWGGGTIYNPKSGNTYDLYCKLIDKNTLEMHFYLTFESIGKTFIWKRVAE